jgi:hypothetical protein
MQDEADITINGTKLTDAESMTVRVAIDTLAKRAGRRARARRRRDSADRQVHDITEPHSGAA